LIEESKVARYPSGTPRFLADLCNKSCVADKEKRIQRVADFRRALEHFLELEQAYILCEQGEKDTTLLQYFMKEEKESHIHQYFHSTRFAFEQSLRIQPDLMRSKEGLERLIDIWIDWSIKTGNESNFHLLNDSRLELSEESQKKIRIYQGEQREEQRERERWLRLGKNHDVRENIGIRLIIVFSLLGVVLFTASHLTENYSFEELMISNHQLMTEGAIMMVPILVFTIVVHLFFPKQYEIIRMAVGFLGTCFVMLLHRMIGFYYDVDPMAIINTDTFIAAFGFWSTYPAFRQGKNVGSFCFLMGICTMFFPDWFWYTNMLMIVAICLAISFEVIVVLRNRKMILLKNSAFASKK
jgi:hypothetical protein